MWETKCLRDFRGRIRAFGEVCSGFGGEEWIRWQQKSWRGAEIDGSWKCEGEEDAIVGNWFGG